MPRSIADCLESLVSVMVADAAHKASQNVIAAMTARLQPETLAKAKPVYKAVTRSSPKRRRRKTY